MVAVSIAIMERCVIRVLGHGRMVHCTRYSLALILVLWKVIGLLRLGQRSAIRENDTSHERRVHNGRQI